MVLLILRVVFAPVKTAFATDGDLTATAFPKLMLPPTCLIAYAHVNPHFMLSNKFAFTLLLSFLVTATSGHGQDDWEIQIPDQWTNVPDAPGGGNGYFKVRKGRVREPRPWFDCTTIKFVKGPNANCDSIGLIQTCQTVFKLTDGSYDTMNPPVEMIDTNEAMKGKSEGVKAIIRENWKLMKEAMGPNATSSGVTVDSKWSDEDPYYNGTDANDNDRKENPDGIYDRPAIPDWYFYGARDSIFIFFEICAYCYNPDGTVGKNLGCIKWMFKKGKNKGTGSIVVPLPPARTGPPTPNHTAAVDSFVKRHTVTGTGLKYCPEANNAGLPEIEALERQLEGETDPAKRDALKQQIKALLDRLRGGR